MSQVSHWDEFFRNNPADEIELGVTNTDASEVLRLLEATDTEHVSAIAAALKVETENESERRRQIAETLTALSNVTGIVIRMGLI